MIPTLKSRLNSSKSYKITSNACFERFISIILSSIQTLIENGLLLDEI